MSEEQGNDELLQAAEDLLKEQGEQEEIENDTDEGEDLDKQPQSSEGDDETDSDDDHQDGDEEDTDEDDSADQDDDVYDVAIGDTTQKVSLKELKSGYMRQADYTKKTQDLSERRSRYEAAQHSFEESNKRLEALLNEAREKVLPSLEFRESKKLRDTLNGIDVNTLNDEQLREYQRLDIAAQRMEREEADKERAFRDLVNKAEAERKKAEDEIVARGQEELKELIPGYASPEKREAIQTDMSAVLISIYGEKRAKELAPSIRSKEDMLTLYYASVGKKFLETKVPEKGKTKEPVLKANHNAGKQAVATKKGENAKRYETIMKNARARGGLTDEEAVNLLIMKGI